MSRREVKDFFISYTSSDAKWAEWIAWELEAAGYSVVVQLWDFHPGNDFIAEMERASREAGQTLAVLSPKYFQSRFTEAEWTAAFKKGNLLPVRVVDFDVEGLLSVRVYIDIVGKSEDQAREVLLEGDSPLRLPSALSRSSLSSQARCHQSGTFPISAIRNFSLSGCGEKLVECDKLKSCRTFPIRRPLAEMN
jgi:hypothetical protein